MTGKKHPQGETPVETIERIAPTPASFTLQLTGQGDNVDVDGLRAAFRAFVRAARAAGLLVGGQLTGGAPGHYADGELVPQVVIHELAGDVPAEDEPAD